MILAPHARARPLAPLLVLLMVAGCAHAPAPRHAASAAEAAAVLAAVEELFDVMATNDVARARALLHPEGHFIAVRPALDGSGVERVMPHPAFIASLAGARERWLERYWDPQVLVHGPIAVVWTPYDFYRDGAFSHCGVDAFTLIRRPDRWVIAGVTYTVETEGCPPSPLGPPGAEAGRP